MTVYRDAHAEAQLLRLSDARRRTADPDRRKKYEHLLELWRARQWEASRPRREAERAERKLRRDAKHHTRRQEKHRGACELPPSAGISADTVLKDWLDGKPCCVMAGEVEKYWRKAGGRYRGHASAMKKLGFINELRRIDDKVVRIWERRLPPLPY